MLSPRPLPAPGIELKVSMAEYRLQHDPGPIRRGRVVLRLANVGREDHQLVVFRLPAEGPGVAEMFRSGRLGATLQFAMSPTLVPGAMGVLATDLAPGATASPASSPRQMARFMPLRA